MQWDFQGKSKFWKAEKASDGALQFCVELQKDVRGAIVFGRCVINNKPAFLEDSDGGGVVFGDGGVERMGLFQKKEGRDRFGGDAAAPKGAGRSSGFCSACEIRGYDPGLLLSHQDVHSGLDRFKRSSGTADFE